MHMTIIYDTSILFVQNMIMENKYLSVTYVKLNKQIQKIVVFQTGNKFWPLRRSKDKIKVIEYGSIWKEMS